MKKTNPQTAKKSVKLNLTRKTVYVFAQQVKMWNPTTTNNTVTTQGTTAGTVSTFVD